ncbi:MAG: 3,5-nucleoside bisphosphate phosphatase [Solirubrobacteraceae bacterium]|nr:3,5-nucleoside bisphosphate phosphatase [Solirubrobacteraceae bacterium]
MFDLQCHSRYSDGVLEPAAVMARAKEDGMELVALTDHDTIDGVEEARAAAAELGMRFSPAAEISAVEGRHADLHVCGYEVDVSSQALRDALEDYRADRQQRVEAIADRLEELGFTVDRSVLRERKAAGLPIGRPHIADAVLQHPENQERLQAEGTTTKNTFFPEYIVPGAKAFVQRTRPTVYDAIDVIHAAGGVAIWAHPFWDLDDPQECVDTINAFADGGLDGVEVFYPTHDAEQTRLLHETCTKRGLLITGSSDFHGPEHDKFNRFGTFELHGLEPNLGPIG